MIGADRILAFAFFVGSLVYLAVLVPEVGRQQAAFGSGDFYTVGPTALPYFAGALLAIFSIAVLAPAPRPAPGAAFAEGLLGGATFAGLVVLAAVVMPWIGFLPASTAFLIAVFAVFRPASWWIALVLAFALPVLLDQGLRKLFLIPLPGAALF